MNQTKKPQSPQQIGLNLLYLIPGEMGGAETYAISLLETMLRTDGTSEYTLFVNRRGAEIALPEGPNIKKIVAPISGTSRPLRYLWEQCVLPALAKRLGLQILHSLHYVGPMWAPCKTVITIPDANSATVGKDMPFLKRFGLSEVSRRAANNSDCVVTISRFSKLELIDKMGIDANRLYVIHSGCGWLNLKQPTQPDVKEKYGLTRPYISAMGGGYPHKNIPRLIQAFANLPRAAAMDLVLIGRLAPNVNVKELATEQVTTRIKLLGYVPTEDIDPILAGSTLFVFPSLYEGFGLPILEAQRAGTPVVCSNAAAIPEVAGQAAQFFDPTDVNSIKIAIEAVLSSPRLQQDLARLGRENVKRFSWENTARLYLSLYAKLLANDHERVEAAVLTPGIGPDQFPQPRGAELSSSKTKEYSHL